MLEAKIVNANMGMVLCKNIFKLLLLGFGKIRKTNRVYRI